MRRPTMHLFAVLFCLAAASRGAAPAKAATTEPIEQPHCQATLLCKQNDVQPGATLTLGLLLQPDEHWHTYWQNPGDSGLATRIQWTLPQGFKAGPIQWPTPTVFKYPGPILNFGYEGPVLLLTDIQVPADLKADSVTLKMAARWLTCSADACLSGKATFSLTLPVTHGQPTLDDDTARRFDTVRADLPQPADNDSLKADYDADTHRLRLTFTTQQSLSTDQVVFFPADGDHVAAVTTIKQPSPGTFVIDLTLVNPQDPPPPRLVGLLKLEDQAGWIDLPIHGSPQPLNP